MKENIIKIYSLITLLILIIAGCEPNQEISWDVDEIPARLVVEGSITDELKKHTVRLSKTDNYFSNKEAEYVSNATVSISDGKNLFIMEEKLFGSGIYETKENLKGEVGKIYTLDIEVNETLNNETHFTASSLLKETITADTMVSFLYENPFIYDENDTVILVVCISGREPETSGDYYIIRLYRNGELLNDTIDEYSIISDISFGTDGDNIFSFFFYQNFAVDDTVDIEFRSISKEYYDFINGIKNIAGGTDPFGFSGPPANPVGNIKGGSALGFFIASSVTRISSIVKFPEFGE